MSKPSPTRKLILIGCSTIAQLLEIEKNKKQDKMFQSFVNLKGSFVNDEYVVKKFEHVHRDKENECFQKSRKLLSVLVDDCDGDQSKGFCICDRLPCLVSEFFHLLIVLNHFLVIYFRWYVAYVEPLVMVEWPKSVLFTRTRARKSRQIFKNVLYVIMPSSLWNAWDVIIDTMFICITDFCRVASKIEF